MTRPIDLTIPQMDILLCLLHLGAKPSGKKVRTREVTDLHYGNRGAGTNAVQGRRTATRNVLVALSNMGLIRSIDLNGSLHWQISEQGMNTLHPPSKKP